MRPKVYKFNVIEGLEYLSDRGLQQKAWLENNEIWSSFNDDVSAVYESSGMERLLYKKTIFGKEADNALRELDHMVMAIPDDVDEAELIDSPEMEAIRRKAAEALALVRKSDGKDSTVKIIESPE